MKDCAISSGTQVSIILQKKCGKIHLDYSGSSSVLSKNQRKRLKARCRVVAREQRAGSVTQQIFTLGYLAHFLESKLEQEILLHMFDKC